MQLSYWMEVSRSHFFILNLWKKLKIEDYIKYDQHTVVKNICICLHLRFSIDICQNFWHFKTCSIGKSDSINPHTTEKNNSHFRLLWGPLDPAISFALNVLFHFYSCRNVVRGTMEPAREFES